MYPLTYGIQVSGIYGGKSPRSQIANIQIRSTQGK